MPAPFNLNLLTNFQKINVNNIKNNTNLNIHSHLKGMDATQKAYREEIELVNKGIETIKRLDAVNSKLQKLNLIFLHPYNQGIDIAFLNELANDPLTAEVKVSDFFAHKFLDLRTTIHFIEGYYKKRPFINDYATSIEESLILCLQKDFKAAIYILLPVIEGTLRKYLISRRGNRANSETSMFKLLRSIDNLTNEYLNIEEVYARKKYQFLIDKGNYFNQQQLKQLRKNRRLYFTLWMQQLENYVKNGLYLNTKNNVVTDNFNRHLIFHALDDKIDYSFSNYLKLFSCINFISWAIALVESECSILPNSNDDIVQSKLMDYLKILSASEALSEIKEGLYNKPVISFKKYLSKENLAYLTDSDKQIKSVIQNYDVLKKDRPLVGIRKMIGQLNFIYKVKKQLK